jgi:hypothetical protein
MDHTPEPWEAVPQPDGSWLLKTPSRHWRIGNVTGTESGIIVARIYKEGDLKRIASAVNAYDELLGVCREAIGFCVNARETWDDWQDHPDVGLLFAKMRATVDKHSRNLGGAKP